MKKMFAIILMLVLTTAMFAGCRSKEPEQTDSPTNAATNATTEVTMPTIMPTTSATTGTEDATGGAMTDATGSTDETNSARRPILRD